MSLEEWEQAGVQVVNDKPKKERKKINNPIKKINFKNIPFKKIPLKYVLFVIAGIIIIGLLINIEPKVEEEVEEPEQAVETYKLVNETVPEEFSFADYKNYPQVYEGRIEKVKGFLERYLKGDSSAGVYVEAMIDDENVRIDLGSMDEEYRELFPEKGITEDIYEVQGVFTAQGLLNVLSIEESSRDEVIVQKKVKVE